jgi:hypothetical protein
MRECIFIQQLCCNVYRIVARTVHIPGNAKPRLWTSNLEAKLAKIVMWRHLKLDSLPCKGRAHEGYLQVPSNAVVFASLPQGFLT